MLVIDYDLSTDSGTIVLEQDVSERIGTITGTFEFEFKTYTDYCWAYQDGKDVEIPFIDIDTVEITSVQYEDELGHRAVYAFDSGEVERHIDDLLQDNLERIEHWMKED